MTTFPISSSITVQYQFKIHWSFQNVSDATLKKLHTLASGCLEDLSDATHRKIKNKKLNLRDFPSHHCRLVIQEQGWLPFAVCAGSHQRNTEPVSLWHQLKHYNVIIKMTNRITHDVKGNRRRWGWTQIGSTSVNWSVDLSVCRLLVVGVICRLLGNRSKQFPNCATYSNCLWASC